MLKILSWNIRQGGGSRLNKICEAIKEMDAAIVVLSEFRNNNSGTNLRAKLLGLGYRFQICTEAKSDDNSVIIASKIPCDSSIFNNINMPYNANIGVAHFAAFSFVGVYLPHKKKHSLLPFLEDMIDESERNFIIAGDYNTGKNYIDQKGNSFWYTTELENLEKVGMKDAFRHVYGDVEEFSWYSHQGNGFRYDHTYISEGLLPIVKDCYYPHKYRIDGLSDHSPMILELG